MKIVKMKISQWASVFSLVMVFYKLGKNFFFVWVQFLMGGNEFEKNGPCSLENVAKYQKKCKMAKNHFLRANFGS